MRRFVTFWKQPSRIFRLAVLLIVPFGFVQGITARETDTTIELGGLAGWKELSTWENVRTQPGWGGGEDVVLKEWTAPVFPSTDLYLETEGHLHDAANHYNVIAGPNALTTALARNGQQALHFAGRNEVVLQPMCSEALFGSNQQIRSFTIDAWVYAMSTDDNAKVLRWTSTRFDVDGLPQRQELSFVVEDHRLVWKMENLFLLPDGGESSIELHSRQVLVPDEWRHHQLSFDGSTGKITYRIDGKPEAIAYANDQGEETGRSWYIHTGGECEDGIYLGRDFVGLIDDLRITRNANEEAYVLPYNGTPGTVVSDLIDLGAAGATLRSIDVRALTPGNTDIEVFYRMGNQRVSWDAPEALSAEWVPVPDGQRIQDDNTGRFAQIQARLYPDAGRTETPRVQNIVLAVDRAPPPIPPPVVHAEPGAGGVTISWSAVHSPDVAGYRVYIGEERGRYTGTAAIVSPVDAGAETSFAFTALEPGRPYVFAVETYDRFGQSSVISREVESRAGGEEE